MGNDDLTRIGLAIQVLVGLALIGLPFADWNLLRSLHEFGAPLYALGPPGPAGVDAAQGRIVIGAGAVLIVLAFIGAGPVRAGRWWLPVLALAPLATAWAATCSYVDDTYQSGSTAAVSGVLVAIVFGVLGVTVATLAPARRRVAVVVGGAIALVVAAVVVAAVNPANPHAPIVN